MSLSMLPRFCSEVVQSPTTFEDFCEVDDYANAIACFGDRQRLHHDFLVKRPEFDSSLKSIVSIFQPKSGGTFLYNRMLELGYWEFWWLFAGRTCHSRCFASSDALKLYMRGGCICHTHARPDPNILEALDRANVEKIWVHLRDPAASVVSCYYHYAGEGHGTGEVGEMRRRQALDEAPRRGLTPDMGLSDFVVGAIDFYVKWIAEWLRFAERHPGRVVFSYYEELADPAALFARVFGQFGVTLNKPISSTPIAADRYRKKATSDWRVGLTRDAQMYVARRVRAEFEEFPEFEALCGTAFARRRWARPLHFGRLLARGV